MGGVCSSLGICESTDDQQTVQQTNKNDGKVDDDKVDGEVDDEVDDKVDDNVADNEVDDDDAYVWLILAFDLRMHSLFDFLSRALSIYTFLIYT